MPVVRHEPGAVAPRDGTYAITTEWESTGVAIWRKKGDRLPLLAVADEGPCWYVLVGVPNEAVQAA